MAPSRAPRGRRRAASPPLSAPGERPRLPLDQHAVQVARESVVGVHAGLLQHDVGQLEGALDEPAPEDGVEVARADAHPLVPGLCEALGEDTVGVRALAVLVGLVAESRADAAEGCVESDLVVERRAVHRLEELGAPRLEQDQVAERDLRALRALRARPPRARREGDGEHQPAAAGLHGFGASPAGGETSFATSASSPRVSPGR